MRKEQKLVITRDVLNELSEVQQKIDRIKAELKEILAIINSIDNSNLLDVEDDNDRCK